MGSGLMRQVSISAALTSGSGWVQRVGYLQFRGCFLVRGGELPCLRHRRWAIGFLFSREHARELWLLSDRRRVKSVRVDVLVV